MNVIFGSAGFAKEVDWLIHDLNEAGEYAPVHLDYFVGRDFVGEKVNGKTIISDEHFFQLVQENKLPSQSYIAIGSPQLKEKIHQKLIPYTSIQFPSLIYPNVKMDKRPGNLVWGEGTIVCAGCTLTTNIELGSFVHLNLHVTVGHDTRIGDYTTVSPGAHISGNVKIGRSVFIGTGAVVLERLEIADGTIVGAGSVVTKSITEPGTYVGMPARRIK